MMRVGRAPIPRQREEHHGRQRGSRRREDRVHSDEGGVDCLDQCRSALLAEAMAPRPRSRCHLAHGETAAFSVRETMKI